MGIKKPKHDGSDIIVAYTDGSTKPTNPGPGGYGVILPLPDGTHLELSAGYKLTTNNRMEMMAFIRLLKEYGPNKRFDVYLDSDYVKQGSMFWIHGWARKGWVRQDWKTGVIKPIQNLDLWKEIYVLYKENTIRFFKVKAHTGDKYNELADELAKKAAENPTLVDEGYNEKSN